MEAKAKGEEELHERDSDIVRAYVELMDEVMPYLTPAEQVVYQRLFRLSYVRGTQLTACRYQDLAEQCGLSLRTLQRALRSLRHKQLVTTAWHSHGATTFHVQLLGTLPSRPRFLKRQEREVSRREARPSRATPPLYESFAPEDRDLFLACKRALSPKRLVELTQEAVEWLTERGNGDPEAFADDALRDKVDELVVREVFGPDRQERYRHLFEHLYTT